MQPVEQTILTPPDGNCMAACVASILERGIAEVPNPQGDDWWGEWNRFLRRFNLSLMNFPLDPSDTWRPLGYWIGAVRCGSRMHAVVMHGSELAWNPDPRRARGVGEPVEATVFVPLDPAKTIRDSEHETIAS